MSHPRSSVAEVDRWNVESMYVDLAAWERDFIMAGGAAVGEEPSARWADLQSYRGRLAESDSVLKSCLTAYFSVAQLIDKLYTYAHLRHDEEITDDTHKSAYNRIVGLFTAFDQETSWMIPEILGLPQHTLDAFLSSPELKDFHFWLEKRVRVKEHTLSAEKEELVALASKALLAPGNAFRAINDADFKFGNVKDSSNNDRPLTHANYSLYLRDHDRTLRKNSYRRFLSSYSDYANTLCELLSGQVQTHLFNARARRYPSCLDASLYPKNIDTAVYHSLINTVKSRIGSLHRYIRLRKKLMGVDSLHPYDLYVPLTSDVDIKMDYQEAQDLVIESVAPLGEEYQDLLRQGLTTGRWVDRFENENKRSGAYSSGCYDSMPYILMNYNGTLKCVFTLAHEAGHSMHSLLSNKTQHYHDASYPIFVAEVASTFNESLLMKLMLERCKSKEEKIYLINEQLEDIRGTFFRQTQFAEFELLIHSLAEKDMPITPAVLKSEYRKLNAAYFGDALNLDEDIEMEWARIPHFYYNFYVYQYATGISAALALSERVTNGGDKERHDYLSFLKTGGSRYPVAMLKDAGVDLTSPTAMEATLNTFDTLLDELESLLLKDESRKLCL